MIRQFAEFRVQQVRIFHRNGYTIKHLAAVSGVSQGTIRDIVNGYTYKTVEDQKPTRLESMVMKRDDGIIEAFKSGYDLDQIAAMYSARVSDIVFKIKSKGIRMKRFDLAAHNKIAADRKRAKALKMKRENPFMTQRQIAEALGISARSVQRYFAEERQGENEQA